MAKVFIKYNPYKVETAFEIEDNILKESSDLYKRTRPGIRLQEWVDKLPELLVRETDERSFEIQFYGTLSDFNDLKETFGTAYLKKKIDYVEIKHIQAKEPQEQETEIEKIFQIVQKGPFPELRSKEILDAFDKARNRDFEMCVIALMSTGKSTLINAFLGEKLMPSSQEACTALITKIKDNDQHGWKYHAYAKNPDGSMRRIGNKEEQLTYQRMEQLNKNQGIARVDITGNIPFVSSKELSLVITDTPGSDNAQNYHHREVQEEYLNANSKSLVLYLMAPTSFGTDSDDALLKRIAENMASSGKQARDRFIFVINKMDQRKEEDGDVSGTLENARKYLKEHGGIDNPNLFPVSALSAMNIRLFQKGQTGISHVKDTGAEVEKLMQKGYAFEEYASLPETLKEEMKKKLHDARAKADTMDTDSLKAEARRIYGTDQDYAIIGYKNIKKFGEAALIHSGVPSVEMAIRQYLEKYARPAKVYDLTNVFMRKLKSLDYAEKLKREVVQNQGDRNRILGQIQAVEKKMSNLRDARQFEYKVTEAVRKAEQEAKNAIRMTTKSYQEKLREKTTRADIKGINGELTVQEASELMDEMENFSQGLQNQHISDLTHIINECLVQTCRNLTEEYRQRLSAMGEEMYSSLKSDISFNPLELMEGSIPEINAENLIHEKKISNREWIPNFHKKWYKPWTWFQEKGHWKETFKTLQIVKAADIFQAFLTPIQKNQLENNAAAMKYVSEETERISQAFLKEFQRLDEELNAKINTLKKYASEREKAEQHLRESQKNLDWITDIENRINQILEI